MIQFIQEKYFKTMNMKFLFWTSTMRLNKFQLILKHDTQFSIDYAQSIRQVRLVIYNNPHRYMVSCLISEMTTHHIS